ncbi:MAG: hypothetical protein ACLR4A_17455 [Christensenellales bacterium]
MKHKTLVCLALAMMLIAACASAQQLPSVNCFSPGLLKVNGLENSAVSIDAALTVETRCTPGICPCFRRCWMERTSAFRRTGKPARFPLHAVAKR